MRARVADTRFNSKKVVYQNTYGVEALSVDFIDTISLAGRSEFPKFIP